MGACLLSIARVGGYSEFSRVMSIERAESVSLGKTIKVLQMAVDDVDCCIPIDNVERVLLLMALEFVPSGPDFLVGLMNFRGRSVPVVDLGMRLGLEHRNPYGEDTPVVLCSHQGKRVGLVAQAVDGVVTIAADALQMDAEFQRSGLPIKAVAVRDSRQLLVLDIDVVAALGLSERGVEGMTATPDSAGS